jgi:N-6 DNA Methylase
LGKNLARIFGSLFQSVMGKVARRKQGAHYTSEKNILRVIEPLFLDDLKGEFARLKACKDTGRRRALEDFHAKLGGLTFFDPACGCGNFLVIAYRELRELEIAVLKELHPGEQRVTDIGLYTKVDVDQFLGIEIGEFPVRIAEVAMWMMDHIMNARLSAAFGESFVRIPLKTSPNIVNADALKTDWANVLAPEKCSYILGNPPFGDSKYHARAAQAGHAHRCARRFRRHARFRLRLVHQGRRVFAARKRPHRLSCHEFDHPRRAGRATLTLAF